MENMRTRTINDPTDLRSSAGFARAPLGGGEREEGGRPPPPSNRRVSEYAQRDHHPGVHGVRSPQLFDDEEPADAPGSARAEEVLQVVPQAHPPQRDQVGGMKRATSLSEAAFRAQAVRAAALPPQPGLW